MKGMMGFVQFTVHVLGCLLLSNIHVAANETTQTIRLLVPVVTLLDIADTPPIFTFGVPDNAGAGLTMSATNNVFTVALTSNNPDTDLNIRLSEDLTPAGISLYIAGTTLGSCGGKMMLTTIDQTYCNIGTLSTGTGVLPTMEIGAETHTDGMVAYGNYSVDVIYTLTED